MTFDEAKNKEQYAINRLTDAKDGYKEYLTDEAIDIAIKAIEQTRWIPVSERLPKIADVYRVTRYYPNNVMNPNYLVDACCFDGSNTWYNDNRINHDRAYADNVIAWQENPDPYMVEPQEKRCADCNHYGKFSLDCGRCDDDHSMFEPQEEQA